MKFKQQGRKIYHENGVFLIGGLGGESATIVPCQEGPLVKVCLIVLGKDNTSLSRSHLLLTLLV